MSPQKENGYTPIANELFEAFYRCKLLEYERVVIMAIWRKTYGWKKKEDWVSNSQLSDETGIAQSHITRTIKQLTAKNIIHKNGKKISVNKLYREWIVDWRKLPHEVTKVTSPGKKKLPHQVPTKEKRNYTKESNHSSMKNEHYVDYETGEVVPIVSKSKTPSKEVIALVSLFETLAEKATGVKPDMTKAYFKLIRSMKQYSLSPEDVKKLYQYFFKDPKLSVEKKVSIGLCISGAYITQWKVSQKNKAVSQVDASSEIYL